LLRSFGSHFLHKAGLLMAMQRHNGCTYFFLVIAIQSRCPFPQAARSPAHLT
jgi:hypothetical protein